MVIELEHDEERFDYPWSIVTEGEIFPFIEDDEELENDDFDIDTYPKDVKELQHIAPHIRWRIGYVIGPYGAQDASMGSAIWVPDSQYNEAEYILKRCEDGDDLTNYSYKDKYPDLYVNIKGEKKLHPDVENFVKLSKEYASLMDTSGHVGIKELLVTLRELLPQLYHAGTRLPKIPNAADYYENRNDSFDFDFRQHDWFFCVDNPYGKEPAEKILSRLSKRVDLVVAGIMAKCLDIDVEKVLSEHVEMIIKKSLSRRIGMDVEEIPSKCSGIDINEILSSLSKRVDMIVSRILAKSFDGNVTEILSTQIDLILWEITRGCPNIDDRKVFPNRPDIRVKEILSRHIKINLDENLSRGLDMIVAESLARDLDTIVTESLPGFLDMIAEDVEPGLIAFDEGDIDRIAAAGENWRISFDGPRGWGQALLKSLTAIHFAIQDLKSKKRR